MVSTPREECEKRHFRINVLIGVGAVALASIITLVLSSFEKSSQAEVGVAAYKEFKDAVNVRLDGIRNDWKDDRKEAKDMQEKLWKELALFRKSHGELMASQKKMTDTFADNNKPVVERVSDKVAADVESPVSAPPPPPPKANSKPSPWSLAKSPKASPVRPAPPPCAAK
jgi:hypothetical protein